MQKRKPIVRTLGDAPRDAASQIAWIHAGRGWYSHDDDLPLSLKIQRGGWLCRGVVVTTLETVWYRDPVTYIEVPAGFTTDLASVPRVVWSVISPWDLALEAIFHDRLYEQQTVKRRVADQTLLSMMEDRGVPWAMRWAVYLAVRLGGRSAWKSHAKVRGASQGNSANSVNDRSKSREG